MADLSLNDRETTLLIEELSANAWPSLQTLCYDGWLLRFAEGFTRRANSVHPLYHSSVDTAEKIRHCERLYASKGQPCLFKMTPAAQPEPLDAMLAEAGYTREAPTGVQVVSMETVTPPNGETVVVHTHLSERWVADFCRLNAVDVRHAPTMVSMLSGLVLPRGFFSLRRASGTVAMGLAVLERGWVGLFDIVTAPDQRNQGLGTQLAQKMLSWGRENGAVHAYLQVMHGNAPALHLYGKLGFREAYSYWYRAKTG